VKAVSKLPVLLLETLPKHEEIDFFLKGRPVDLNYVVPKPHLPISFAKWS
jgi:hypothetical protein